MDEAEDGQELKGVGRDLRAAREAMGKQITDVTQALRISVYHLEALENGRYTELPDAVYVYGFVRSYAGYLQLDADEMVRRVKLEFSPEIIPDALPIPSAPHDSPRPSRNLLLLAMFLAVVVLGFWYLNLGIETGVAPDVTGQLPEFQSDQHFTPPAPGADAELSGGPATAMTPKAILGQRTEEPETEGEVASHAPEIPSVEELVGQIPSAAPPHAEVNPQEMENQAWSGGDAILAEKIGTPEFATGVDVAPINLLDMRGDAIVLGSSLLFRTEPAAVDSVEPAQPDAPADARVVFRASSDTWMQVSYANGAVMRSWVMRAGEQFIPPADQTGLKVMVGNAGALTVFVDGAALRPLGKTGAVIRNVPLDAAGLNAKFGG